MRWERSVEMVQEVVWTVPRYLADVVEGAGVPSVKCRFPWLWNCGAIHFSLLS